LTIEISHQVSSIGNCHIIVAATSAPEVVITSKDVSPGSIIINDAQPSDISPDIITDRKDVIVIEGGVLNTPNIDCNFNLGLANKTDIFSCLAETVLLTYGNQKGHYSTDSFDANFYAELKKHSEILNFKIGHPQNTGGYIEMNHLQEFAKIIARRQD
jgi:predicted amino acid dehydrogenase